MATTVSKIADLERGLRDTKKKLARTERVLGEVTGLLLRVCLQDKKHKQLLDACIEEEGATVLGQLRQCLGDASSKPFAEKFRDSLASVVEGVHSSRNSSPVRGGAAGGSSSTSSASTTPSSSGGGGGGGGGKKSRGGGSSSSSSAAGTAAPSPSMSSSTTALLSPGGGSAASSAATFLPSSAVKQWIRGLDDSVDARDAPQMDRVLRLIADSRQLGRLSEEQNERIREDMVEILLKAIRSRSNELVTKLLDFGIALNTAEKVLETYRRAVKDRMPEVILSLGKLHHNPNGADPHLLHVAIRARNLAVLQALLTVGCDPNHASPLSEAVLLGFSDAITPLLRAGAMLHLPDPHGRTPLLVAVLQQNLEMVERLLLEGANPNLPGNANFVGTAGAKEDTNLLWVPPVYAAVTARCGNVEILRLLLCSFARISCHLDKSNEPPAVIQLAEKNGFRECVDLLNVTLTQRGVRSGAVGLFTPIHLATLSDRRVPEFLPLGPANRVHKGLFRDSVDGMQAFFDLQQGSILLFPAAEEEEPLSLALVNIENAEDVIPVGNVLYTEDTYKEKPALEITQLGRDRTKSNQKKVFLSLPSVSAAIRLIALMAQCKDSL